MAARLKLFMLTGSLRTYAGGSINEEGLMKALAKYSDSITTIDFRYLMGRVKRRKIELRENIKMVSVPCVPLPWPIWEFLLLTYSFIYYAIAVILGKTRAINAIYLRDSAMAFAFSLLKRLLAIPLVVRMQSIAELDSNMRIRSRVVRSFMIRLSYYIDQLVINKADVLIVPSVAFKYELEKYYHLPKIREALIGGPGISFEDFEGGNYTRVEPEETRVGYIGTLHHYQGVDLLIDAMPAVCKVFPKVTLYIVGGGALAEQIRYKASKRGVTTVVTGHVSHKEAVELLRTFKVMVIPRRKAYATELLIPMKLIEALACGVPVVATRSRCLEQFMDQLVFAKPEADDLSDKIIYTLKDQELRKELIRRGMDAAKAFDYGNLAKGIIAALAQIGS